MTFREYKFLVYSDLHRITNTVRITALLRHLLAGGSFKYTFWMRTCLYAKSNTLLKYSLYPCARILLNHLSYKYGIEISPTTRIGSGLYIGHFGGIVVNSRSIIGKNCNISPGVTLAQSNRGVRQGCPRLGDNVFIGPGAKILGAVTIGDDVAIGANCVVTKDVPSHSVVVGVPGRVISREGSKGYIGGTDYEGKIR